MNICAQVIFPLMLFFFLQTLFPDKAKESLICRPFAAKDSGAHEQYTIDFHHLCRQTSGRAHLKGIWWADILEGASSSMPPSCCSLATKSERPFDHFQCDK